MKKLIVSVVAVCASALSVSALATAAEPEVIEAMATAKPVSVTWQNPDNYRDIRASSSTQKKYEKHVFTSLGNYMQKEAAKVLAADQSIQLTIHNLDLAGDVTMGPRFQASDVRVIRSLYPPMMDIEFKILDGNGKVIAQQRDKVKNMGFMQHSAVQHRNQAFNYDKAMIKRWISKTLKPAVVDLNA